MGKRCCIICLKTSTKEQGISLHGFPKNLTERMLWLKSCNLSEADYAPGRRICSLHFREEDLLPPAWKDNRRCLKPGSVPRLVCKKTKSAKNSSINSSNVSHKKNINSSNAIYPEIPIKSKITYDNKQSTPVTCSTTMPVNHLLKNGFNPCSTNSFKLILLKPKNVINTNGHLVTTFKNDGVSNVLLSETILFKPISVISKLSKPVPVKSELSGTVSVKSELPEPVSVNSELPELVSVKSELPEPVSVKSEFPEPVSVKSELPEPVLVKSELLESVSVKSEFSKPASVISELLSEPVPMKIELSESMSVKSELSETVSVKTECIDSTYDLAFSNCSYNINHTHDEIDNSSSCMYSEKMDIKCEIVDIVDKCPPTNYLPTENFSSPVKDTKIKHTSLQEIVCTTNMTKGYVSSVCTTNKADISQLKKKQATAEYQRACEKANNGKKKRLLNSASNVDLNNEQLTKNIQSASLCLQKPQMKKPQTKKPQTKKPQTRKPQTNISSNLPIIDIIISSGSGASNFVEFSPDTQTYKTAAQYMHEYRARKRLKRDKAKLASLTIDEPECDNMLANNSTSNVPPVNKQSSSKTMHVMQEKDNLMKDTSKVCTQKRTAAEYMPKYRAHKKTKPASFIDDSV